MAILDDTTFYKNDLSKKRIRNGLEKYKTDGEFTFLGLSLGQYAYQDIETYGDNTDGWEGDSIFFWDIRLSDWFHDMLVTLLERKSHPVAEDAISELCATDCVVSVGIEDDSRCVLYVDTESYRINVSLNTIYNWACMTPEAGYISKPIFVGPNPNRTEEKDDDKE